MYSNELGQRLLFGILQDIQRECVAELKAQSPWKHRISVPPDDFPVDLLFEFPDGTLKRFTDCTRNKQREHSASPTWLDHNGIPIPSMNLVGWMRIRLQEPD